MKCGICILLFFSLATWHSFGESMRGGDFTAFQSAMGKVVLHVLDSVGNPVSNASVNVVFWPSDSLSSAKNYSGNSDAQGYLEVEGKTIHFMDYFVEKDGFYTTRGRYWFRQPNSNKKMIHWGRWQPWGAIQTVVLKELRAPAPMYAKYVSMPIPALGVPIGFDVEKSDWVIPYGQGDFADLIFTYESFYQNPLEYTKSLSIRFSNPQDGIQSLPLDMSSELKSVYEAPREGYQPEHFEKFSRTQHEVLIDDTAGQDAYFVFKVRTQTNAVGEIISENFGKIYNSNLDGRPIEYGNAEIDASIVFTYYYNPAPNDRNVEFSPDQNLFKVGFRERRVYHP